MLTHKLQPHAGDSGPEAGWIAGLYCDEYRLEPEGWRVSLLELDLQIMSPYEDGWAKTPMMS